MAEIMDIVIIGAGPSGLAVAGRLAYRGVEDYKVLDSGQSVGQSWRSHYDRLHLHTVKQYSALPHKDIPKDYPLYVPKDKFAKYLQSYADSFGISPQFDTEVISINAENENWKLETNKGDLFAKKVVIASGVNRIPNVPTWEGDQSFEGSITHSKYYKNPKPYIGKKVLVIGMGNTGAEVAYDLSNHGIETYLSVRSPVSVVPRDLHGRPVQVTAKMLDKLPLGLGDWIGSKIRRVHFGDLTKFGLPVDPRSPVQILKTSGKTPMIDIGTIKAIKNGEIIILPNIKKMTSRHVITEEDDHVEIDSIILATGYKAALESLVPGIGTALNEQYLPKGPVGEGEWQGLYFIGYDNYKLGGILGTVKTDSQIIVDHIQEKL